MRLHCFFQVCGFYLQRYSTKDGGSPASQQKGLLLFTANNFQETATPHGFHLGSLAGG